MNDEDRLRSLADLVPILEAPDADFGRWEIPAPRDGVHSLGWFAFGPEGDGQPAFGLTSAERCAAASAADSSGGRIGFDT